MNSFIYTIIIFGIFTLAFGVWTLIGLWRHGSRRTSDDPKKKVFLGVCADFSWLVGIPLWIVRLYAIVYIPLLVGIPFYFLYYWMMKWRKTKTSEQKGPVNVTRMDIHRY